MADKEVFYATGRRKTQLLEFYMTEKAKAFLQ